jgi:hypothetical protein
MLAITDCTAYFQSADKGRWLALLIATSSSDSIVLHYYSSCYGIWLSKKWIGALFSVSSI